MHQEWLSSTSSSSAQGHLQKLGKVAPGRKKEAGSHDAGRAGSTMQGALVKLEHYLHRNVS